MYDGGSGGDARGRKGDRASCANTATVFDHLASRDDHRLLAAGETGDLSRSCFGFSARATFGLRFTRDGISPDVIDVVEMRGDPPVHDEPYLLQWPEQTGVAGRLFGGKIIFDFFAEGLGWYRIAPFDRTIEVPRDADAIAREAHLWGVPAMLAFTRLGDLSVHAAAVADGDAAVILAAPAGFGRTALTLAMHEAGCRVLTQDIARVRFEGDVVVLPGPAVVRRPATDPRPVPRGMHLVGRHGRHAFLSIDEAVRGDARPVRVAAVVLLREGRDAVRVWPSDPALRDIWPLTFRVPGTADDVRTFEQLQQLVERVPVYDLERPMSDDALPRVVAQVRALCRRPPARAGSRPVSPSR
jgi:hypothetical protein